MSDTDPDVLVPSGDNGSPPPGAAAVFQGMLSVLGQELEGLRKAMVAVESGMAAGWTELRAEYRADVLAMAAAVAEQVEQSLGGRLAELWATTTPEPLRPVLEESVTAITERLERLEETVRAREQAAAGHRALLETRLAGLEAGVQAMNDGSTFAVRSVVESLAPAIEDVNDRVSHLEEALDRLVEQADLRSSTLASELQGVLAGGMERLVGLAARSEQTTAAELQGTRTRVDAIATSVADLSAEVAAVAEAGRQLADEGRARPVIEAIDAASRENGEVLAALHASITRRLDARLRSLGEVLQGMSEPLGAVASLAPRLDEVRHAVASQEGVVERLDVMAAEVLAGLAEIPDALETALARRDGVMDELRLAVGDRDADGETLRASIAGIEASVARSLEGVRSYLGEGLMHVSRRQAGTGKAMASAAAALQSMERQLKDLAGLCQSLVSGVDQQTGASARVADLLLEARAALRGDVDRLEATVHLEAVKLHQQDQGRLAAATSATTDVVEREAALLAQRVSAVAAAVESVRNVLHDHVEEASRAAAAPLSLVKEN